MPGFDHSTVPQQVLYELMETDRAAFSNYLYKSLRALPVKSLTGTIGQLPIAQGRVGMRDAERTARTAPGAPTPKGNSSMSSRAWNCFPSSWAEPITDIGKLEASLFTSSLASILRDRCGHNVAVENELELEKVLLGNGVLADGQDVTTRTLGAGEYFDVYDYANQGASASDVAGIIKTARDATGGGTVCIMGDDVAEALCRHPQITLAYTGNASANTILSYDQLIQWLRGRGLADVRIASHEYTNQARELGYSRAVFFQGVFAIMRPGAIVAPEMETMRYDSYRDEDRRTDFARCIETRGVFVPIPEDVYCLKTVLTP